MVRKKQKLLEDIVNAIADLSPQAVENVKCSDGIYRHRPLIDIAEAVEVVKKFM